MSATCVTCGAAIEAVHSCWRCGATLPEPRLLMLKDAPYIGAELHFADGTVVRLPERRIVEVGRAVPDRRIAAALSHSRTVSRRHAAVLLSGLALTIEDRASSNGTYVDATEAQPSLTCPLQPLILGLGQSVQVRIVPTRASDI
jgi:hypothetical protein